MMDPRIPKQIAERLTLNAATGCLEWSGAHARGYGIVWEGGRNRYAHRLVYAAAFGPIHDGMFVCHHCDNPKCCNPDHLFLGTNRDNMLDAERKGRLFRPMFRGESHPRARLNGSDVLNIRRLRSAGTSLRELGRRYGVDHGTIRNIVTRRTWRWLED